MNPFKRIVAFFAGLFGEAEPTPRPVMAGPALARLQEPVNDAAAYGVTVERATVPPNAWYWQAVRVHHLTPEENGGNHHIYLDVQDPALISAQNPLGRVYQARLRVTWDGGEQMVTIDKPLNEPGANFPMWKWQVCAVQALGLAGQELPSDRVTGIHTGHPDEAPGNTLFHHSFSVTFCRVQAPAVADSVIYGVIHRAAGRTVALLSGEQVVATQTVAADDTFRFADLSAGEYVVTLQGTALRSDPRPVNGRDQAYVELTFVPAESVIAGQVRNGAGRTLSLRREGVEVASQVVAEDESYRFADLIAGVYQVAIMGTPVVSGPLTLDGLNQVVANLTAPRPGKSLAHYVLFGPAEQPATKANLLLAQDFLLTFTPAFGFNPAEAAGAAAVTIIADTAAVGQQVEQELVAGGAQVQRIAGTVEQVAAELARRIVNGQPFA